jgi:hypothetical protein
MHQQNHPKKMLIINAKFVMQAHGLIKVLSFAQIALLADTCLIQQVVNLHTVPAHCAVFAMEVISNHRLAKQHVSLAPLAKLQTVSKQQIMTIRKMIVLLIVQ